MFSPVAVLLASCQPLAGVAARCGEYDREFRGRAGRIDVEVGARQAAVVNHLVGGLRAEASQCRKVDHGGSLAHAHGMVEALVNVVSVAQVAIRAWVAVRVIVRRAELADAECGHATVGSCKGQRGRAALRAGIVGGGKADDAVGRQDRCRQAKPVGIAQYCDDTIGFGASAKTDGHTLIRCEPRQGHIVGSSYRQSCRHGLRLHLLIVVAARQHQCATTYQPFDIHHHSRSFNYPQVSSL